MNTVTYADLMNVLGNLGDVAYACMNGTVVMAWLESSEDWDGQLSTLPPALMLENADWFPIADFGDAGIVVEAGGATRQVTQSELTSLRNAVMVA